MYGRESWGTDVAAAAAAVATGYLLTTWQKASAKPLFPLLGTVGVGIAGVGGKHLTRHEYGRAVIGAAGIVGLGNVGNWVAEATTTMGGKAPGAPPVYLPKAASTGAAARAALARAQVELAQRQADLVRPNNPNPGLPTTVFQYPEAVA